MKSVKVKRFILCVGVLSMSLVTGCASMQTGSQDLPKPHPVKTEQASLAVAPASEDQQLQGSPVIQRLAMMVRSGQAIEALQEGHLIWQAGPTPEDMVPLALLFARTYAENDQPAAAVEWLNAALAKAGGKEKRDSVLAAARTFNSRDPQLLAMIGVDPSTGSFPGSTSSSVTKMAKADRTDGEKKGRAGKGNKAKIRTEIAKADTGVEQAVSSPKASRASRIAKVQDRTPEVAPEPVKKKVAAHPIALAADSGKRSTTKGLAETAGQVNESVQVVKLKGLPESLRKQLRAGRTEAGKVWNLCRSVQAKAQRTGTGTPDIDTLLKAAQDKKFKLDAESVRIVCEAFLTDANAMSKSKSRYALTWSKLGNEKNQISFPMGDGHSIILSGIEIPKNAAGYRIVWNNGYELHVMMEYPVNNSMIARNNQKAAEKLASAPEASQQNLQNGNAKNVRTDMGYAPQTAGHGASGKDSPAKQQDKADSRGMDVAFLSDVRRNGSQGTPQIPTVQ